MEKTLVKNILSKYLSIRNKIILHTDFFIKGQNVTIRNVASGYLRELTDEYLILDSQYNQQRSDNIKSYIPLDIIVFIEALNSES